MNGKSWEGFLKSLALSWVTLCLLFSLNFFFPFRFLIFLFVSSLSVGELILATVHIMQILFHPKIFLFVQWIFIRNEFDFPLFPLSHIAHSWFGFEFDFDSLNISACLQDLFGSPLSRLHQWEFIHSNSQKTSFTSSLSLPHFLSLIWVFVVEFVGVLQASFDILFRLHSFLGTSFICMTVKYTTL